MKQYFGLVQTILSHGTRKENRTGVDTISTFSLHHNIDMREGFPLLTSKKINWKNIVVENLWFLSGDPSINLLKKHGCKFWDAWADENGMVPSAYGNFWRRFPVHNAEEDAYTVFDDGAGGTHKPEPEDSHGMRGFNDQIAWVTDQLKKNPMSRSLAVSAWAPGNAQTSKLAPCHLLFVFNVQNMHVFCPDCSGHEKFPVVPFQTDCTNCPGTGILRTEKRLCLHLTQRSCDIALGVPYNIAGYGLILSLMSRFTGIPVGIFGHTLLDAHAYTCKPDGSMEDHDHLPGLRDQLTRTLRPLPTLTISDEIQNLGDIDKLLTLDTDEVMRHFVLNDYNPHPAIKFKVAV